MIIRLTQKLAKKVKETDLSEMPLHENPLADWSANLFTTDRTQYILVSNTKPKVTVRTQPGALTRKALQRNHFRRKTFDVRRLGDFALAILCNSVSANRDKLIRLSAFS